MKLKNNLENIDFIGDNHIGTSSETPIRPDAFELSSDEKINIIKADVQHIMETLGLDLSDDSLKGTPNRVAKMFVNEIFGGLDPANKPKASTFDNKYQYGEMLVEKNITLYSTCEHHFLPIVGRAHVAYISNGTVVGLSKMNRIVDYFAKRPQVQERLTIQIVKELQKVLNTKDFGNIPHNRERIFMIGFDKENYPDSDTSFKFPQKENLSKKISDIIEIKKVDDKFYYKEDKYMYSLLKKSIQKEDTIYQFRRHYVRENKSNVCPTLTANMGTGGHNVPLIKTKFGFRKLTPRECFRFQGFTDSYKLPNIANRHLYKQSGNSVSVSVISKIAKEILKVLDQSIS